MKLIHSLFAFAFALLFSISAFADDLAAPSDPERSGISSSRLGRIAPWYQARVDALTASDPIVPGAVAAIAKDGKLAYLRGITVTLHSTLRQSARPVIGRLRSAPERAKAAVGLGFQRCEKAFRTDGAAHAFSLAQPRCRGGVFLAFQQVGEAGKSLADRGEICDGVIAEAQVGARARPLPIFRAADQSRSHGVQRHIAEGGGQMRLVHRDAAEPSLPEVAGAFTPRVDHARVTPMHARQRSTQTVFALPG
ncbi:MAG: hypothetical protein WAL59_21585 [Roseiarcus sp.]